MKLLVALDPHGMRPLSLGKLGDAWVVASETSAFDLIGAEAIRSVEPGELLIINDEGLRSERFVGTSRTCYLYNGVCLFFYDLIRISMALIFIWQENVLENNLQKKYKCRCRCCYWCSRF